MDRRPAIPPHEIRMHLLIQPIVIEQAIHLHQHRVGLVGSFRHAGKDVFGRIAVDEHQAALLLLASLLAHSTTF